MNKKIIAGLLAIPLSTTTVFAYDITFSALTDKTLSAVILHENEVITATYTIKDEEVVDDKWELKWEDNFDSFDETTWGFQLGTGWSASDVGWGNNEKQYYTKENTKVENGELIITAKREEKGGMNYTSSRLWSNPNQSSEDGFEGFSTKYGKIEAAITLPEGDGMWPAFWLLPKDEVYGGWPVSGEVDIMEARGRELNNVHGTIHYGAPRPENTNSGGTYYFPEGQDLTGTHVYSIEWVPGEIRWYVDGNLYHTENNWFSKATSTSFNNPYPAPFNQEFYLVLNLAIGGDYDNGLEPPEDFVEAEMKVDYVKVYELKEGYDENVQQPEFKLEEYPEGSRQPDENGNFITSSNFEQIYLPKGSEPFTKDHWNMLFADVGVATVTKLEEEGIKVNIENGGNNTHSVQFIDHMAIPTGRIYELTFDAKADDDRTIISHFGAGEALGWKKYSKVFVSNLTDKWQTYTYRFRMEAPTDPEGRLDINIGTSNIDVYLKNIIVKEVEHLYDNSEPKQILSDGNHIYNGSFNLGPGGTDFWEGTSTKEKGVVVIEENQTLYQQGINMIGGNTYKLSFDANDINMDSININFKENSDTGSMLFDKNIELNKEDSKYEVEFTLNGDYESHGTFMFSGNGSGSVEIDNITLNRLTHNNMDWEEWNVYTVENGDFSNDMASWSMHNEANGNATSTPAIEDGAIKIDITNAGTDFWHVLLMNNGLELTEELTYEITYDAWADTTRDMNVSLETSTYAKVYAQTVNLGTEKKTYTDTFSVLGKELLDLKFQLGNRGAGTVYIDNVDIRLNDVFVGPKADLTQTIVGENVEIEYKLRDVSWSDEDWAKTSWEDAIEEVLVNDKVVDYTIEQNKIIIDKSEFSSSGEYTIKIKAAGYLDSEVKLR